LDEQAPNQLLHFLALGTDRQEDLPHHQKWLCYQFYTLGLCHLIGSDVVLKD
jgi:hypothetical protein